MSLRLQDVLLFGGGECLARFGVPFMRLHRGQGAFVHTRSGDVGPFTDRNGVLRRATANRLRTEWLYNPTTERFSRPAILPGGARTNLITVDGVGTWDVVGTPGVVANIDDPTGGLGAFRISDNDGVTWEYPYRPVTFTGGSGLTRAVVFIVREGDDPPAAGSAVQLVDTDASVIRAGVSGLTWPAGVPTPGSVNGTYLGRRPVANGYWAIVVRSDGDVDSANAHRVEVRPAWSNVQTGSIDFYRVNVYDTDTPPWSVLSASESVGDDSLYAPIGFGPQALALYLRGVEGGTVFSAAGHLGHLGGESGGAPSLSVYANGLGFYQATYRNGIEANINATLAEAPSVGDDVEHLVTLDVDRGASSILRLEQSIAGAAPTSDEDGLASYSGYGGRQFNLSRFWLGSLGTVATTQGFNPTECVLVARGTPTIDEIREFIPRLAFA